MSEHSIGGLLQQVEIQQAEIKRLTYELAALKSQEPAAQGEQEPVATHLLDENKQLKAIHEADILSLKNLVRECDEYKIRLSQAQESINYWMEAADEARAQITIARIQEREGGMR